MTVTIDDITTHTSTAVVLIRGSGFTDAEAAAMRTDMDTFLATTVPETIGDLSDVDETGAATGMALLRNAANDGYVLGSAAGSLAIVSQDGVTSDTNVTDMNFTGGMTVVPGASGGGVNVLPTYAGTGNKDMVARSDHTHTTPTTTPVTYTSKGTLSSGSVTLVTTNVTLPAAGSGEAAKSYKVTVRLRDTQTGQGGSSYYLQKITIDGTTSTGWERRTVGGVPLPGGYEYTRTLTGTGTSKTITVELTYSSGDPMTVEAGGVFIDVSCNR